MNRFALTGLALALAAVPALSDRAEAFGDPCCCQPGITFVDKVVTCYRTEVRCREVPCTTYREVCRQDIYPQKYTILTPVCTPVKREVYVYKEEKKEVEREVTSLIPAPECPAPCGCNICQKAPPTLVVQKIKTIECVPSSVKVEVMDQKVTYQSQEYTRLVKGTIVDRVPETTVRKETYCVTVPYQVVVKVPVGCAPCGCGH
jgi:hypothetical protein